MAVEGQYAAARYPGPNAPCLCERALRDHERLACYRRLATDWAGLARYAEANGMVAIGQVEAAFMGDSITDFWCQPEAGGFFPNRSFVNRGIDGQTTSQMLVRMRSDVIALAPKVVVILGGTNDVAGRTGPISLDGIVGNLASMAELAVAHKIRVVLASVLPVSKERSNERPTHKLQELNAKIAALAAEQGHTFINYHRRLLGRDEYIEPKFSEDGLHPNACGYASMTPLALDAIAMALSAGASK